MTRGVSIIVDCYNHERYVKAAIESALAQDHSLKEIIVVDDGSTDNSSAIIRSFLPKIRFIEQTNQGQVAACHNAFAFAQYDIIIFLDSDDLLEPCAARRVAEIWTPKTSKVQFALKVIAEDGEFLGSTFPKYPKNLSQDRIKVSMLQTGSYPDSPTSGNAYSRKLLADALPSLPRIDGFDGELNGLAPLYGDVLTIREALGSYRIHGNNAYSQKSLEPEKFEQYLRHSYALLTFLRESYSKKGLQIAINANHYSLKYLEYEVIVARLLANEKGRRPIHILRSALQAVLWSGESVLNRFFRFIWLIAMLLMPKNCVRVLAEQRFVPAKRWIWMRTLLR